MPRAVLRNGVIHPLDPLPREWQDGQELWVEQAQEPQQTPAELEKWWQEFNALCEQSDPEDDKRLQDAINEHRRQAKEMMRREMGL